jgi:PAS domain S-box-containing protein
MPKAEPGGGRLAIEAVPDPQVLAAVVDSSDDAILTKDADAVITSWNRAAERIYGYTAEEAIGSPVSILIPPKRAGEEKRILARILAGDRVDHYETERVTKEGRAIVVSLTVSPLRNADGEIVGASVIARDITERHRSRELAERLQEVTSELSREASEEAVIGVILDRAIAALGAQAGAVALVEGDEIEIAGAAGYTDAGLTGWRRFPLDADVPMTEAVKTGAPVWVSTAEELTTRYPALADTKVRFAALAVLPLVAGGAPFGAIALSFDAEREFDLDERTFLVAGTQNAAHALARAQMYERQRLAANRERFLAGAGELLSRTLDPDVSLAALAELAIRDVADWCGIDLVGERGELRSVAVAHIDPAQVDLARRLRDRYPPDPSGLTGVPHVVRTGRSELYAEIPEELLAEGARDDEHLEILRRLGLRSAMIVPLSARGRTLGAITLISSESGRIYGADDLRLAEDLARRAALALDNAMLYRREHEAALTLQRALLPQSLPTVPGIEFEARYHPAAAELEVGGDWYEVVALDDGTVGVTIGDIAGRGIGAASMMGRVRPALRAYVLDGHRPAEAVARLDRLMREFGSQMTTVFHLHYDPATGRASYVRAGHPPSLLRLPDGSVTRLAGVGCPPLGIIDGIECTEDEVELPAGSLLLLYTDGLIERRGTDLFVALDRLERTLAEAPAEPSACLDWLEDRFGAEAIEDDVAMLAMSV